MESMLIRDPSTALAPEGRGIYLAGAIAAISTCVLVAAAVGLYFVWPYSPDRMSAAQVLEYLARDPLGALVSLDVLMLIIAPVNMIVFISLFTALFRTNMALAITALACGMIAFACLIVCRPIAELAALSGKYALTPIASDRAPLIAAAEGLLAYFNGTAWMIQTALFAMAGLFYASIMRKSRMFSKADSVVGIIVSVPALGFLLPKVGILFLFINTIGTFPWYIMIARRLWLAVRDDG